jgi:hypothetical protein
MSSDRTFTGFFSYAHIDAQADPKLVDALTTTLETRVRARLAVGEFTIWRDTQGLRTGDRWDPKIEAALRLSPPRNPLNNCLWHRADSGLFPLCAHGGHRGGLCRSLKADVAVGPGHRDEGL